VMAQSERRNSRTVLVVDDEQDVLILLKLILETHGYRALLANGAESAMRFLSQENLALDLQLTDVVMPGMAGTDLAKVSKELRPDLPILFMSGFADTEAVRRKVWDDAARLLHKPFSEETFMGEICDLLGAAPSPDHPPQRARGTVSGN
jgi:two-component system cell cycle sensor histidine kinase/response regulator CckA